MDAASPRDVSRDRSRRAERQSRFSDAQDGGGNRDRSRESRGPTNRIYVSNIPYEFRWQDLKDLARELVGEVKHVELFSDENQKPRGCGIVEFNANDAVALAMEKMNRHEINGRHLVVKEDYGDKRDACGRVIRGGGGGGRDRDNGGGRDRMSQGGGGYNRDLDDDRPPRGNYGGGGGNNGNAFGGGGPMGDYPDSFNTYGLNYNFLSKLGIQGPLYHKIFVANLDYKVDRKKLKQVFRLAGRVVNVDLSLDKDGNSRGFAVVEFEHPVEAVQAISMFDRQTLFDRRMTVRMDRIPESGETPKLPEGLKTIGPGLTPTGEPIKNVSEYLEMVRSRNNRGGDYPGPGQGPNMNNGPPPNSMGMDNPPAGLLGNPPANPLSNVNGLGALLSNLTGSLNNPITAAALATLNASAANAGGSASGVGVGVSDNQTSSSGGFNLGGGVGQGGFQNSYSTPVFNTNLAAMRNRSYDDQGGSNNNPVRSYSTQDFGSRGQSQYGAVISSNTFSSGGVGGGATNSRKSDTIIIKNLPPTWNWQMLRDKFREVGEVKHAEMRTPDTGIVRFNVESDAELAIKIMDGARIENQTVYVSFF